MNNVLFLDTETSGLDPAKDRIVELGCVRWSIEHACILSAWSTLIQGATNEAEKVNRIPAAALAGASPREATFSLLGQIVAKSDVIVAHNAEFDRAFLPPLGKPWVCSMDDLPWTDDPKGFASLVSLALNFGLGVASAHRALTDCLLLARLFERLVERGVDVRKFLEHGLRPKALFKSLAPFEEKDKVKSFGFHWAPLPGEPPDAKPTTWWKRMAVEDAGVLPFRVQQCGEARVG
jgi:DNA polymerase-3 subunit epsilon